MGKKPVAEDAGRYTVDAVSKALSLLMIVANKPNHGLSDIARWAGESKARVFRLLRTLEQHGFVVCSGEERRYRLGHACAILARSIEQHVEIVSLARPLLQSLSEEVGETTQLRVRDGDETVCILGHVSQHELQVQAFVGRRRPMYAGSGKTLLAYGDRALQQRILSLPMPAFTPNTITTPEALLMALERIRRDGFCLSRGEINPDLVSVSAPVLDAAGGIAGLVCVAAPTSRMPQKRLDACISATRKAARRLSERLGAPV